MRNAGMQLALVALAAAAPTAAIVLDVVGRRRHTAHARGHGIGSGPQPSLLSSEERETA